jgi:SNF2 family DNA or RNA helicase
VESVIPSLMRLGHVRIDEAVSGQLVQTPLKAELYLDRVKNRLLAGLEFHYDHRVINPLQGEGQELGPVFIREGEKERRIMQVMEESLFTKMLGIIGRELTDKGLSYYYLDGHTPSSERVELCSRFNEGAQDLFLISLKAGGTGLNLTGADTVVLYDLWWNPAVEQQAADRAHRMGQKNNVHVIRLIARGTIEDKMNELQEKKRNLIGEVIQAGQEQVTAMTEKEIREILMIH